MLTEIANGMQTLMVLLIMGLVGWVGWLTKANSERQKEIANVRTEMANQMVVIADKYAQNPEVQRVEDKLDKLREELSTAITNIMGLLGEIKGRAAAQSGSGGGHA